jgi:hypothetical protein
VDLQKKILITKRLQCKCRFPRRHNKANARACKYCVRLTKAVDQTRHRFRAHYKEPRDQKSKHLRMLLFTLFFPFDERILIHCSKPGSSLLQGPLTLTLDCRDRQAQGQAKPVYVHAISNSCKCNICFIKGRLYSSWCYIPIS